MDKGTAQLRMTEAADRLRVDDIDGGVAHYVALWNDLARCPIDDVHLFKYPEVVRIIAMVSARADALAAAFAALATPLPTNDDPADHHNWLCVRAMAHDDAAMITWFDQSSVALREHRFLTALLDAEVAFALARDERWADAGRLVQPVERMVAYRELATTFAQPHVRAQAMPSFRAQSRELGMMLAAGEQVAALNELCDLATRTDRSVEMKAIVARLRDFYYSL